MALPDLVTNAGQKIQELIHPPPTPLSHDSPLPQPQIIPQFNPSDELPQTEVTLSNNGVNTESDLLNEKISFSTIYLSLRKSCVDREIYLMEFTHYLTEQYLRVYGYDIGRGSMQCIFLNDFISGNFDQQLMEGKTFVIFATNALQSMQYIEQEYFNAAHTEPVKFLGHVNYGTRPQTILVEAYKADGKYGTAWILSHELAHLILHMKGSSLHSEGVHSYEYIWRDCSSPDACPEVWLKIDYPFSPYKKEYYMMDVRSLL